MIKQKKKKYSKGQILKEALTPLQQEEVLEIAKKMKKYQGHDPYKIICFFLRTGIHSSVLAFRDKSRIHIEGDYIVWYRPKKKGLPARTQIKIHSDMKPWINEFLLSDLPKFREWYWGLCKKVGKKAKIPDLSPMSFRHSLGRNLDEAGCTIFEIAQILNCSLKVAQRYSKRQQIEIDKKLEKAGW
jgi:integrase